MVLTCSVPKGADSKMSKERRQNLYQVSITWATRSAFENWIYIAYIIISSSKGRHDSGIQITSWLGRLRHITAKYIDAWHKWRPRPARAQQKIIHERLHKRLRKYVFSHRVIKTWNSLPKDVINSKDVIHFEKSLDSFWKTQTLLYDDYNAEITTSTNNTA